MQASRMVLNQASSRGWLVIDKESPPKFRPLRDYHWEIAVGLKSVAAQGSWLGIVSSIAANQTCT